MSRKLARVLPLLGLVLAFLPSAMSAAAPVPGRGLKVTFREKEVRDLTSAGLKLIFKLAVANQEDGPRFLVRYRYKVDVERKEFFSNAVTLDQPIAIQPGAETYIGLPVKITYAYLFAVIGDLATGGVCQVSGDLYFTDGKSGEDKVSFEATGDFPVFKEPQIILQPVKVNDLTVGGSDVVFAVEIRNPNPYDLLIGDLAYELKFAGVTVSSGSFPGDKSIPRKDVKIFTLPMLLDFFESGDVLRGAFRSDAMPCRFTGRLKIQSVWGTLDYPFDIDVKVALNKKQGD